MKRLHEHRQGELRCIPATDKDEGSDVCTTAQEDTEHTFIMSSQLGCDAE